MQRIKYFFSCILVPLKDLMNFGKHISITEEAAAANDDEYERDCCKVAL